MRPTETAAHMNRFPGFADAAAGPSSGPRLAAALVVCVVIFAYLPAAGGGLFTDDIAYVAGNERLQSIPLSRAWMLFIQRTNPYEFLPLRDLSYRIDLALFGLEPRGYHLHNLLLYALCCAAVWLCTGAILRLFDASSGDDEEEDGSDVVGVRSSRSWARAVVTILFAVHPAHVESVAWISGRKELLSGLFTLLAIWQFALGIEAKRTDWRNLTAAYAFFALALASKATALPLVGVAFLMAAAAQRRATMTAAATVRRLALVVGPMVLIAVAWLLLTLSVGSDTMIRLDPMSGALESIGGRFWAVPMATADRPHSERRVVWQKQRETLAWTRSLRFPSRWKSLPARRRSLYF